jgi:predicted short-subunit dehydrogenase-like oxidoreductase (DUF2520 family)
MNISFIGAGNVAWHLAQAFENAGHWICEIYSRTPEKARKLASQLYDSESQNHLNFSESDAELFIIAVTDSALEDVMQQIVFPENTMVVHTSGTRSLAELRNLVTIHSDVYVHTGVLYPLQSFSKNTEMDYRLIPFCIESTHEQIEAKLIKLAQTVSDHVERLDSDERFILHVAAVFANNFVNHLLTISHDLLEREQLSFELLKPIIASTVQKAIDAADPSLGQTGPARRGDDRTSNRHLSYLQSVNSEWTNIYELVTESIKNRHLSK